MKERLPLIFRIASASFAARVTCPALTPEARGAILSIKTGLAYGALPEKFPAVALVYEAVLAGGVTDVAGFDGWMETKISRP